MTKEDFAKGMKLLSLAYTKEVSQEQIEVWYSILGNYTAEEFSQAVQDLIKTERYMPSIAQITESIAKQHIGDYPSAEDEWNCVKDAIRKIGFYRQEEALNSLKPFTREIVERIGFTNLCMADQDQQVWNRKEFIDTYNNRIKYATNDYQIGKKTLDMLGIKKINFNGDYE